MKLEFQNESADNLCILCQQDQASPDRQDGLCDYCGTESDYYEDNFIEEELNLERDELNE